MRFKTKIDFGYQLLFIASVFYFLAYAYTLYFTFDWVNLGLGVVFFLMIAIMLLPQFFMTDYTIGEKELFIRSGLFIKVRVPIKRIDAIKPHKKGAQFIGLSSKRLMIIYKDGSHALAVSISPKNKDEFLAELNKRINKEN